MSLDLFSVESRLLFFFFFSVLFAGLSLETVSVAFCYSSSVKEKSEVNWL